MEEAAKTAYVSPPHGVLEIAIIRDANPRVTIALDLGIPNFTVFSMNLPLAEGEPRAMSELIAEAVNVLCDEVASFMMAQQYEEPVIVKMYQTVLSAFKSMSTEADTAKEQDAAGQDPTVQIYEGTFDIPMDFINATQEHVVTGAVKDKDFQQWFRGSKVVDKQGNPLRVYHGTTRAFQDYNLGAEGMIFFTTNADNAGTYATSTWDDTPNAGLEGSNVRPVFLSIKNPLHVTPIEYLNGQTERGVLLFDAVKGHDGLRIASDPELDNLWDGDTWAVFSPKQVKSVFAVTGAAKKIKREPKIRHIELTYSPKQKTKPSDTARVIRQYRNRSLRQQPKPMFVIVYDQLGRATGTIPIGTGKTFKNQLLKMLKKGSVDFTAPVSFVNEQEMKAAPLNGTPRAISIGGMTYQPEAVAGGDMALYHGPQDYIVKFTDGRSQIFPGRPTFRKMRLLNFPVPRNRFKWTMIPQELLEQPKDMEQAPKEEVKEAAEPEAPQANTQVRKDSIQPGQVWYKGAEGHGPQLIYRKPEKTYDDLVPLDKLQKRLKSDGLAGKQVMEGKMVIDRVGFYGMFEGKNVIIIPHYFIRRYGVKLDDGNWQVYHLRRDGRVQRVGFRAITDKDFIEAKPAESGIGNKEST